MFQRLFARRRRNESIAYSLYGAIVAQARQPALYRDFHVPDTLDGRFDMIVLHAFLLFHRMKGEGASERELGQGVFDVFLKDMDRNLREMGVSDIGVPKKLKKMAEAFYGRVRAYDESLSARDGTALAEAIDRNVFPDRSDPTAAAELSAYAFSVQTALAGIDTQSILEGRLDFPALEGTAQSPAAA